MLITVEDAQNRAEIKLKRAVEEVNKLLVPAVSDTAFLRTYFLSLYSCCKTLLNITHNAYLGSLMSYVSK